MNVVRFAWRSLLRDWRAGELRLIVLALVIAVGSVSAVGFFTDRVRGAMERQAGELLAADRVLESGQSLKSEWLARAREWGLATARTQSFRTVVSTEENLQLVEVKAAGDDYPLRGELRVAPEPFAPGRPVESGPEPGGVWLEARLAALLNVEPGDAVRLGREDFIFSRVLVYEPDRGGELFAIAPRVMMHLSDVPATGLIQTGSLVTYRLLLSGEESALNRFGRWIEPQLNRGQHWRGSSEARPAVGSALEKAEQFLGLAALVAVLLAGVAAATAAHRHAHRQYDATAVMRCLGASQRWVTQTYLLQLFFLGVIASALGCLVGFASQEVLGRILAELFTQALPAPSAWPLVSGMATGLVTLTGFAVPPLLSLKDVPPMRVLRQDPRPVRPGGILVYGGALAALLVLMLWQAKDVRLTLYVFVGAVATLAVLGTVAALLVGALMPLRKRVGVSWRFGLANIPRRARQSRIQVVAFGLGITVLLLLSIVRGDLLSDWRDTLPPDAPNHFLINVQPDQVAKLEAFLQERVGTAPNFQPMIKGRLSAINGEPVVPEEYENPRAQRLSEREFNLSSARQLAPDNRIVAGQWWGSPPGSEAPGQWSVEEGIAETLGIEQGDRLRFRIAGKPVEGTVTSLRSVDWDSFRVNFFVIGTPALLKGEPASFITSFFVPETDKAALAELVRRFPNVTVVDVDAIMSRVRAIIDRVSLAVEFVFMFTLAAGVVVLLAAIQATRDERLRESALMRTLGASRRQVRGALIAEFLALGLLSGALAALSATLLGYLLASQVFHFPYQPGPGVWVAGLAGGTFGVSLAGLWATRRVLSVPPLRILRRV
ncbi:ABC transporter permease [Thiohalomonas denitrificans]|uniref:Putative ABC transport system permease protein n=1 Tax=Thiohalomonas denitrificans TaxID=415747 RepID=A0A1G5PQS2_9GAMM|nr:FtsX-like permease family protein [Thiohalomonas denitrificans]SCZ51803.1 putative ABC transport system permease protein [Thiohalomonas denitrificans]